MPTTTYDAARTGPRPLTYVGQIGRGLRYPAGLHADGTGLWVADTFGRAVHHYDRRGRRLAVIGAQHLAEPRDVTVHDGLVHVVDSARGTVEVFTTSGRHRASLARGVLLSPRGIAVEASGDLLVSDVGNNRVARIDPGSGALLGAVSDGVHVPHGLAVVGDGFWVVSSSRQYDGDNGVTHVVGDRAVATYGEGQHSTFGALSNPAHVAIARDGSVLVSVPDYGFVSRFTAYGTFVDETGTSGRGLLRQPLGLALAPDGDLLVADSGNRRVAIFRGLA